MLTDAPRARSDLRLEGEAGDRRNALVLLAVTSAIGGTGLAAGGTASVLVGAQLAGTDAAAGLPLGLLVLGSAGSALAISRQTSRVGRGWSLAAGYLVGAIGAVVVIVAATAESLTALLVGSLLLGGANASIFLSRYAAAELGGPEARGRALGLVFFSTSIGAVGSPLLLAPSGALAHAAGLPRLSGIFVIAALTFGAAAVTLGWASRKNPAHVGVAALFRADGAAVPTRRELIAGVLAAPARLGLAMLAAANFVMVAFMAVAPIHLMGHGQGLETIGTVISLHVAAMFAPSPLSGWLADRAGPVAVGGIGFLLILFAGLAGAIVDQERVHLIVFVLVMLGIGWNFAVVGGSTLIARSVPPKLRVHVEGIGEAAMGVAATTAAPAAGVIIAFGGFTTLSLLGATIAAACALTGGLAHQGAERAAARRRTSRSDAVQQQDPSA